MADAHNHPKDSTSKLTRLEEKVVSALGMNIMDGHQSMGEGGFQYQKVIKVIVLFHKVYM